MSERFAQYDGGKGPEDRSNNIKRAKCPLWKQVKLPNVSLTPEEAQKALKRAAALITESWNDNKYSPGFKEERQAWMKEYFPENLQFLNQSS